MEPQRRPIRCVGGELLGRKIDERHYGFLKTATTSRLSRPSIASVGSPRFGGGK
jgi:hypothetical protein